MKRLALLALLLGSLLLLSGCGGGQEIESCLFVLSMAVDPAPDGSLTVTVKALSGTQDAASPGGNSGGASSSAQEESSQAQSPLILTCEALIEELCKKCIFPSKQLCISALLAL